MPAQGIDWIPHEKIMTYEDIFLLCSVLSELGVKRIRFTGGEPFVRKGFVSFLHDIRRRFPEIGIAVTTNGDFLERWASELIALGLNSVNISLDTLNPEKFLYITRGGILERVLRGIDVLAASGEVPVKLNTVVMREFNLTEIPELVRFADNKKVLLRFIEFMPLDTDVWSKQQYVSADEVLSLLPHRLLWQPLGRQGTSGGIPSGPAQYFRNESTGQKIGIISAVSDHFCHLCNRLRITSTGEVRPCLFSNNGIPIIDALRRNDRESVRTGILSAVSRKPRAGDTSLPEGFCSPEEAALNTFPADQNGTEKTGTKVFHEERHMSRIGG
jgi:cyclic pyranopterin phosphate synthase